MAKVNCPLCTDEFEKEELKTNTHYLTNSIIKRAINYDGSKNDNKGLYVEIDDTGSIEINFQQGVTPEKFIELVGRPYNNEELHKSNSSVVIGSVNHVFCKECEIKFGTIETKFMTDICPKLRNSDLIGMPELLHKNSILIRVFFLLQIWRSSVVDCEPDFKLSSKVEKELRDIILEYASILSEEETVKKLKKDRTETLEQKKERVKEKEEDISGRYINISKKYPLIIHYLETIGKDLEYEYTKNPVLCLDYINPFTILMNDFIVQFYESKETLKYTDLYGLNSTNFRSEANVEETLFKINIKSNSVRKKYLEKIWQEKVINHKLKLEEDFFIEAWHKIFGIVPEVHIIKVYLEELINSADNWWIALSPENIQIQICKFIEKHN